MKAHLYLVGLRGAGKTTIGLRLSARLAMEFVDMDREIQSRAGRTISEIFARDGEAKFRDLESEAILQTSRLSGRVVALGGGACERSENRQCLRQTGKVVWLTDSPEQLWQRVGADVHTGSQRPALSDRSGLEELKWLAERRGSNYAACADFTWDTNQRTPEESAIAIATWWQNADK